MIMVIDIAINVLLIRQKDMLHLAQRFMNFFFYKLHLAGADI